MYTVTTDNTKINQLTDNNHWVGVVDKVTLVYEYLFSSQDSIVDKNKFIILFVQHSLQAGDFETMRKFLEDSSLEDLDKSILYSISILTKQFIELKEYDSKLDSLIAIKN